MVAKRAKTGAQVTMLAINTSKASGLPLQQSLALASAASGVNSPLTPAGAYLPGTFLRPFSPGPCRRIAPHIHVLPASLPEPFAGSRSFNAASALAHAHGLSPSTTRSAGGAAAGPLFAAGASDPHGRSLLGQGSFRAPSASASGASTATAVAAAGACPSSSSFISLSFSFRCRCVPPKQPVVAVFFAATIAGAWAPFGDDHPAPAAPAGASPPGSAHALPGAAGAHHHHGGPPPMPAVAEETAAQALDQGAAAGDSGASSPAADGAAAAAAAAGSGNPFLQMFSPEVAAAIAAAADKEAVASRQASAVAPQVRAPLGLGAWHAATSQTHALTRLLTWQPRAREP